MAKYHPATARIRRLTNGCCDAFIDCVLAELFLTAYFISFYKRRSPRWIMRQVDRWLEEVNATTVRRALLKLRQRGLIETIRGSLMHARITAAGRQWASERFPMYRVDRPWDGRMYLVTYDVPERLHRVRDHFRVFLRSIHCGPLQASVWVTPHNPRRHIASYVRDHHLPGVIISVLGKGSMIGEVTYRDLMARAFTIDAVNGQYEVFLRKYRKDRGAPPFVVATAYLAILRDDPQLPRALLPPDWYGDEAFDFVRRQYGRARRQKTL